MFENNRLICVSVSAVCAAFAAPASADIVANFTGGDSSALVDGYQGTAGSGWTGEWRTYSTVTNASSAATTVTAATSTSSPLTPSGGRYLSVSTTSAVVPGLSGQGVVERSWSNGADGVGTSGTVKIEFNIRPNVVNSGSRYAIFDSVAGKPGTDSNVTFQIAGFSSGWSFYDGKGSNNTTTIYSSGTPLVTGHTYHMAIEVTSAGKWRASVVDLDATVPTLYSTDWLGFRTSNTDLYRNLYFGTSNSSAATTDTLGFDLDSVTISAVPEPASLGLCSAAALLALMRKKR